MRVATVDGLITLFYDGSKELFNPQLDWEWHLGLASRRHHYYDEREPDLDVLNISDECRSYLRERLSWQQIIIVDGITEIPQYTFNGCKGILKVIFADTVIRIESFAFSSCKSLVFVKLSVNLEYIGQFAFAECNLSSAFIPPTCREIRRGAFDSNANLSLLTISQDTIIDMEGIIDQTALARASGIVRDVDGYYSLLQHAEMSGWIKNINNDESMLFLPSF